jgi:hypothetical protein
MQGTMASIIGALELIGDLEVDVLRHRRQLFEQVHLLPLGLGLGLSRSWA